MPTHHKTDRPDIYRSITESIVAAIEAGAGAFVMPWHRGGTDNAKPENAYTRMEYHGVNVLTLWAAAVSRGYEAGYWASYKQWQQLGAQVREAEWGTPIVFYKRREPSTSPAEHDDEPPRSPMIARASHVFNVAQVVGWQPPPLPCSGSPVAALPTVEAFVGATKAEVIHGGTCAYYHIGRDVITLPDRERFVGTATSSPTEAYAATLRHELVHWSGARHRLDRPLGAGSREAIAREELVAEIGAAFLCADLGVANIPRLDHAAYVADWLRILRGDTRAIFTAAKSASTAARYLHEIALTET